MSDFHIGLVGFGNIGTGVVRHLQEQGGLLAERCGRRLVLKAICDKDLDRDRGVSTAGIRLTSDYKSLTTDPSLHAIIELVGGTTIAKEVILSALSNGKHVVTANKAVLATFGGELFDAARANNVELLFEASVGAGIPAIRALQGGLLPNQINGVYGILNGTCNFILTAMEQDPKLTYGDVLKVAMEKGYAEPDPTLDVEGDDTAHKIAIMGALAFGYDLRGKETVKEGITKIRPTDFEFARNQNATIKLVAAASPEADGSLQLSVWPTVVPLSHPLGGIRGVINSFLFACNPAGNMQFTGAGAGQGSTSSGIVSDLCLLAQCSSVEQLRRLNPLRIAGGKRPQGGISQNHPARIGRLCGPKAGAAASDLKLKVVQTLGDAIYVELPAQNSSQRQNFVATLEQHGVEGFLELRLAPK